MASIKIRARSKGGETTVKTLISHPMETGLRKDNAGKAIPAHFISEVTAEHNGKPVMTAHWGTGISKNPYLSFVFDGGNSGDTIKISWTDNTGASDSAEETIK